MQQAITDLQAKITAANTSFADLQNHVNAEIAAATQARAQSAALLTLVEQLITVANSLKDEVNKLIAAAQTGTPALGADDVAALSAASTALDDQIAATTQAVTNLTSDTAAITADTAAQSAEADKVSQASQLDSPTN